ncbi:LysR family transcriptional regulator [Amycolatopsis mediterranei S699]|uniref:LysR family transcriptional regulator n=3 Tax=Amycolatopsis mediterranei TaxID=33910 RepID=A0A0H3DGQ9_AMYMU|nr:LysR family transcriptional regulator [Amycolatopsis mediterranei]ADJ49372.1 LysR family transcriptional regulator [Amycolatopsis mediterranei U32]AEK46343.1 LysR family transcriptional regulator [Amycolatopsis mediterranei S699]AFO81080.1 LysR family transcriptional regulator [Amycolatopsis mediterranei S699]AGT88208.1 LysR family transcriptional regulator [Amycolatopsis mediterranei RB]KDO09372.1 LysR family transcriptional regulator [Amycolatopsis mediterranei]
MPTLRALECLVAVLDAGSITEAAARLHLSQPALSHQIGALERELGTPVLERLPRGVRPTAAGRAVLADARAALAAAERVVRTGRAVAGGGEGTLRVACAESMTAGLLAPVLRAWHRHRPEVLITLTETTSADALAEALETGEADIAVGPRPSRWTGSAEVVGREEIVVALTADHPLAARTAVPMTALAGIPVVHYHRDNGLGSWLDQEAARSGTVLDAVMRTRQAATAAQLAAAGLGVALVPTTALTRTFPGALRRLKPPLHRDVVTFTATPSDSLVRRFSSDVTHRGLTVPGVLSDKLSAPPG